MIRLNRAVNVLGVKSEKFCPGCSVFLCHPCMNITSTARSCMVTLTELEVPSDPNIQYAGNMIS